MIGRTAMDIQLNQALKLDDAIAWFDAHTQEVKEIIIYLIQDKQLGQKGVNANNEVIGYYSYVTELISGGEKKAGEHYTLEDTGSFFSSMFVTVLKDSIIIDGDSAKMEEQEWWSDENLGLTDENLTNYAKEIRHNYIEYARKLLFGN